MKKAVLAVIIISAIIVGGILFAGFLSNQEEPVPASTTSQPTSTDSVATPQETNSTFTIAEVAEHSSPEDCWVIIETKVYDVTNFLTQHPGGADRITPFCGQDATEAFANQGGAGTHSSAATQLREDFLIGSLAE